MRESLEGTAKGRSKRSAGDVYGHAVPCVGEGGRVDASRGRQRSSEKSLNSRSEKRDIRGAENPQGIPTKSEPMPRKHTRLTDLIKQAPEARRTPGHTQFFR